MPQSTRDPIAKALEVVVRLAESPGDLVGVRELAAAMGVSPSSAHRLLLKLVDAGFVAQERGTQRYGLGAEFFRLGQLSAARQPFRQFGIAAMRQLVARCNETALLGYYDPVRQEMFFAASVESTHPLRYVIALNQWMPVYAGASGLAIMAFLEPAEIEAIIARTQLAPVTELSITDPEQLRAELGRVRRQGYALTRGQRTPGAVGLAAPIFDGSGLVVGDVCVTIPEQRFRPADSKALLRLLGECVGEIGERLRGARTPVLS